VASAAWQAAAIPCNVMVDECPVELHNNAKFLTQIGVLAARSDDALAFLRTCKRELDFLSFVFMGETNHEVNEFFRHACLYSLPVKGDKGFQIVAGTLRQWIVACQEGTNEDNADVVEWFCRVRILLSEQAGLSHVFTRFYEDPVIIDGKTLFRLRPQ
jgi:hypothetical protein